jgi:hypothetical protein
MFPAPDLRGNEATDAISVMPSTSFRWCWASNARWFVRIVIPASYASSLSHAQDGGKAAALAIASAHPAGPPHEMWEVEPGGGVFPRNAEARRIGDLIEIGSPTTSRQPSRRRC